MAQRVGGRPLPAVAGWARLAGRCSRPISVGAIYVDLSRRGWKSVLIRP